MSTIDDGGPAFPVGSGDMRDPCGMSLRDYFAGQALVGILASTPPGYDLMLPDRLAETCFIRADAMLAVRKSSP